MFFLAELLCTLSKLYINLIYSVTFVCHMTVNDLRDMQSIVLKLALASLLHPLLCHSDLLSYTLLSIDSLANEDDSSPSLGVLKAGSMHQM